jgi:hypothetical protein
MTATGAKAESQAETAARVLGGTAVAIAATPTTSQLATISSEKGLGDLSGALS